MSLKRYLGKGCLYDGLFLFDFIYILWYNLVVEFKLKNIKNKINIWGLYGKNLYRKLYNSKIFI